MTVLAFIWVQVTFKRPQILEAWRVSKHEKFNRDIYPQRFKELRSASYA